MRAYVPAGDPKGAYPLLFLFDGQNVFGDEGSFAGGWHAHAAVDGLGQRTFQRPIVIGIDNGGRARIRELGSAVGPFIDGIVREVVPSVERRFDVLGPPHRIIGGSSLGGLAALWAWTEHPQAFGGALAMSPSLWFDRKRLMQAIRRHEVTIPHHGRLYLDAGKLERGRMFADAEQLADRLSRLEERLMWRPDSKGTHQERHWRRRLPKALRFFFRK